MAVSRFQLPAWVRTGASFDDVTSPDPDQHDHWHVRAVADDAHVVLRRWTGGRWHYELWPAVRFTGGWKLVNIRHARSNSMSSDARPAKS